MLVTFKTDAHASITMFGDVALDMLRMMGIAPLCRAPSWRMMFLWP